MNAVAWFGSLPASSKWRELALAHGPRIATWALALLLGVQAALLITDLAGGSKPAAVSAVPREALNRPKARTNVALIANAHLFGTHAAGPGEVDAANAPQTNLALVLTGIIAGDDPSTGLAIVGESASSAKVYGTGDTLPGGPKLHAVYGDRVLIDRNGQIESLVLPRQFAGGSAGATPLPQGASDDDQPVERVRRLIAEQPSAVSEIMRPQPVFAQGKQKGYRVYPGRNRQAFVRLGLRPGDLVTAINGTPLDDPGRGQEIFQTLGSASEARVTVMRNGRQQDLSLNMSQVAQQAEALSGEAGTDAGEPQLQVPEEQAHNPDGEE